MLKTSVDQSGRMLQQGLLPATLEAGRALITFMRARAFVWESGSDSTMAWARGSFTASLTANEPWMS